MWTSRLLILFLINIAVGPVMGHSLSTSHGVIAIKRDGIVASVSIQLVDILHYAGKSIEEFDKLSQGELKALGQKFASQIGEELVIRDGNGQLLAYSELMSVSLHAPPDLVRKNPNVGVFNFVFRYQLARPVSYLTLQQKFFSNCATHESQLSLNVKAANFDTGSTHVILTNRGNAPTIAIEWPSDSVPKNVRDAARITTPIRFSSVLGQLWITDKEIVQEIDIPLPLLETWMTLNRHDPDFVTGDELSTIESQVRSLTEGKNQLKVDGKLAAPQIVASGFLGPDDAELPATPKTPVTHGYYITRAAIRLRYPLASPAKKVEFEWQLFNNAILDAELELHIDGKMTGHTLTKYAPGVTWERP
jgi:hypothetical protein